ncbi:hypothetical protein MLD38_033965 [Melastoma candidum]|uniref:Uncharacterized protein n=1 Tax=Melastoma candidum TaxID=119954 RepID=A0ACB9M886_9MYRT|nr:hypothetical protein MLD38_033965 [Melastoma candidum]
MIKPLVDYLLSLGLPKMILARRLEKWAYVLGYDLEETVKPNVKCLLSFGVRADSLPLVIARYPQILGLLLKDKLASQKYFFSFKLKIDPDGFAEVVKKMPQIISLHQHVIMKPVEFLLGWGIPAEDVSRMIVRSLSNSLQLGIEDQAAVPEVAGQGIRPLSLNWLLNCSDQRFEQLLLAERLEPDQSGPLFCMGGKLELPGHEMVSDAEVESDIVDDEVQNGCATKF